MQRFHRLTAALAAVSAIVASGTDLRADSKPVRANLLALYNFSAPGDGAVSDQDNALLLDVGKNVTANQKQGRLILEGPGGVWSAAPAKRIRSAVVKSGALSVEVWCRPADTKQKGPARIVTISVDSQHRNFTLGQDGNRFDVRLRTTKTSPNGLPSLSSSAGTVTTELTHVVYTRGRNGKIHIYINGESAASGHATGDLSNWDASYHLGLGDERSSGRTWRGELHRVVFYDAALDATEVRRNFAVGPEGEPSAEWLAEQKHKAARRHFEVAVAPLLARRCLECHDAASNQGGLNLSTKAAALRGGESGPAFVAGKAHESELFLSVQDDRMPHEREPLSAAEKRTLKKWIEDGAVWSLDEIDPAVYAHRETTGQFVQRLTVDEYIETVRATMGVDISTEARERLPTDLRADGFSNTAYNLGVDLKHIDAYARLAETIVERLDVEAFVSRFSKRQRFRDKDMEHVIARVGKWILRGPVESHEVIAYRGIMTTVAGTGGTYPEAAGLVIEAMLQSPRFLYRVEQQGADTSGPDEYELASRLSYLVWGGPPDDELMRLADEGVLSEQLKSQVDRMLQDARARRQSKRFLADWLNLKRLRNLAPHAERFPEWDSALAEDMRRESLAFFEYVIWDQQRPLAALINSDVTFATPRLAKLYGLTSEPTADSESLVQYDLSNVPNRGGLLTQGSVLTIGGDDASMVTRGLLVMHELLRGVVNDPPPCVDTTPVPTKAGLTQRGIAMQRIANPACGGCHSRFEPLAFGLEKFDGIGQYHEQDEHGNPLRDDGDVLIPGAAKPVGYSSLHELRDLLAASDRVQQTLIWKVTQFGIGRPLVAGDVSVMNSICTKAAADGGTWPAVVRAIATSDLITKNRE